MDTKLEGGDFATNERNLPYSIQGLEEALQRAWLCLAIPKESFLYDPELGSRLHLLGQGGEEQARALCGEALLRCPGFRVLDLELTQEEIHVTVATPFGTGQLELVRKEGGETIQDGNNDV